MQVSSRRSSSERNSGVKSESVRLGHLDTGRKARKGGLQSPTFKRERFSAAEPQNPRMVGNVPRHLGAKASGAQMCGRFGQEAGYEAVSMSVQTSMD